MIRRKVLANVALIAALMAPPHLIAGPKPGNGSQVSSTPRQRAPDSAIKTFAADLIIQPKYRSSDLSGAPRTGFCGLSGGKPVVVVVVKNIGGTKTPATELLFRFSDAPSTSPNYLPGLMNVGPLNPGQQQTVLAHPLPRAWVPNRNGTGARLYFRIEADWKKEIFELKENNNKAKGSCVGPVPD